MSKHHSSAGFTLIEMIVAVAIIIIVTGFAIASFISFNDKQQVQTAAREAQLVFRKTQSKARVKENPTGCTNLEMYRVEKNGGALITTAMCVNGGTSQTVEVDRWTIPDGVTLNPGAFTITYKTLHGGAGLPADADTYDVTLAGYNNTYTFEITKGGEISTGAFTE